LVPFTGGSLSLGVAAGDAPELGARDELLIEAVGVGAGNDHLIGIDGGEDALAAGFV